VANEQAERVRALEDRVEALGALLKNVLTTLMLRGILNRADLAVLLQDTAAAMGGDASKPGAAEEIRAIAEDMPSYLRTAVGPPPDPDEDDH
jgi:hypothetical protein